MSPFGVVPTGVPSRVPVVSRGAAAAWWARLAADAAAKRAAQNAPPTVRYGRCPASSTLHCRLYSITPRGDGTFDPSVVGYIVPGGVFQIGPAQVLNLRTDQPGSFGLQAVSMVPVVYGQATGWMPSSGIEVVS